jgi:hypothetical protein
VSTIAAIVAHQGGWDEALLIAGPIVIIVVLLRVAKRRVDAAYAGQSSGVAGQSSGVADDPVDRRADDPAVGPGAS